jgi:hypothetical protein
MLSWFRSRFTLSNHIGATLPIPNSIALRFRRDGNVVARSLGKSISDDCSCSPLQLP